MSALAKLSHKKSPRDTNIYKQMARKRWDETYDVAKNVFENEVAKCIVFINSCANRFTKNIDSYMGKHIVERHFGGYISEEAFCEAVYRLDIHYVKVAKTNKNVSDGVRIGLSTRDVNKFIDSGTKE